jgi:hypothetical protein
MAFAAFKFASPLERLSGLCGERVQPALFLRAASPLWLKVGGTTADAQTEERLNALLWTCNGTAKHTSYCLWRYPYDVDEEMERSSVNEVCRRASGCRSDH